MNPSSSGPEKKLERLTALLEVSAQLNSTLQLDELLQIILDNATKAVGAQAGSVILLDESSGDLTCKVAMGEKREQVKEWFRLKLGQGIAGWVAQSGEPLLVSDVKQDKRFYSKVDEVTGFMTESILCTPLKIRDKILGVLEVVNSQGEEGFTQEDLDLLIAFSSQAAVSVQNAILVQGMDRERRYLREALEEKIQMVGSSPYSLGLRDLIAKVGPTDSTVLLRGESGTGKELVARALHQTSRRSAKAFVCVNCAALSASLLESELFGHEKGAFTGADRKRIGRFELADGGTVFLDEIGVMSLETQVKFLRVLQEREFERVGSAETLRVDTRIIAATNEELESAIAQGKFREDLYYRLKVVEIQLEPLRQRPVDIQELVTYYLQRFGGEVGKTFSGIEEEAVRVLEHYSWPGNIRELRNAIEHAVVLGSGPRLTLKDLPHTLQQLRGTETSETMADMERRHIERVLRSTGWNKRKTATILQVSRNRLDRKIEAYGLRGPEADS
ncbi:MAG: sigma 54-interacting transcriptional regulator [Candidatus Omnitrophica bacterium]|nr:sigma 54-interacting transcriptional regulator [Candidatus Omnitrophota bacterium]